MRYLNSTCNRRWMKMAQEMYCGAAGNIKGNSYKSKMQATLLPFWSQKWRIICYKNQYSASVSLHLKENLSRPVRRLKFWKVSDERNAQMKSSSPMHVSISAYAWNARRIALASSYSGVATIGKHFGLLLIAGIVNFLARRNHLVAAMSVQLIMTSAHAYPSNHMKVWEMTYMGSIGYRKRVSRIAFIPRKRLSAIIRRLKC